MEKLIVRSRNPNDVTLEEAGDLVQSLRQAVPEMPAEVEGQHQEPGRFGVTWFQIIELHLPEVEAAVVGAVVTKFCDAAIDWAKRRFKKKPQKRPIYIPIYGPDGEILKSVVVKDAQSDPEDRTEKDRDRWTRREQK